MGERQTANQSKTIRTLGQFASFLDQRGLSPDLRAEVIKIAKGYPEGSLEYLYTNIEKIISKCQTAIRKRENGGKDPGPATVVNNTPPVEKERPKPKWTTASANQVKTPKKTEAEHLLEMAAARQKEAEIRKAMQDTTAEYTWMPTENEDLETFRQKLKWLNDNDNQIVKDIEERRKMIGEAPPDPKTFNPENLNYDPENLK